MSDTATRPSGDPFLEMKTNERADIVHKAEALKSVAVDMQRSLTD